MGIFIALIVFSLLIFVHELGHFTAARFFGVQVDRFSIGFGKTIYAKVIGKTEWRLSWIPLGGYVQMKGQDDSNPTAISYDADSYTTKKPWQRMIILFAGPFANFLLAFVLYIAIANIGVPKLLPYIGKITLNTPAHEAALQRGDRLLTINNHPILYWNDISRYVKETAHPLILTIDRNGTQHTLSLTPKIIEDKNIFGETITRPIIGIEALGTQATTTYHGIEGLTYAWEETKKASLLIVQSIAKLINGAISLDNVGGVITIVDVTAKASHAGIIALFFFTALISINLGVLNLLPIPALDGGHIIFNLYEMITRKKPNEQIMLYLTIFGWAILLSLMFLGLYNDIHRLIGE